MNETQVTLKSTMQKMSDVVTELQTLLENEIKSLSGMSLARRIAESGPNRLKKLARLVINADNVEAVFYTIK